MMSDNEIEIIDLDSNDNNDKKTGEKVEGDKVPKKKTKKRRLKKGLLQTIFCLVSLSFIIGCCIFYGRRLIKYYKIYNPKTETGESIELISNAIMRRTEIVFEGAGLYRENGLYVFKGDADNNYLRFANMDWRIIRNNADGSLEIILDDAINALAWDTDSKDYIKSNIHKYLNDIFLSQLDSNFLVKTSICTDKMEAIDKFVCDNKNNDSYVKLLAANDFLNSVVDNKTFMVNDNQLVWLSTSSSEKIWHTNGSNISNSDGSSVYLVKPVVTIKNSTQLIKGTGSKEDPYIIEKETKNIKFGSYVKLDNDIWVVYDKKDDILKLAYSGLYKNGLQTYRFDTNSNKFNVENANSLAKLLNTTFYDSLSYKDMLLDIDVYTGGYTTF